MKLLFLASGSRVPTTRFRVLDLVPHLRAAGHACTVANSFPQKYDYFRWFGFRPSQWLKRMVRYGHLVLARCRGFDAIILERELFHNATWDMEARFRQSTKTLVLDIDDAVFLNFPDKFPRLVEMSDLVLAGNRLLKEWLAPFHVPVVVMPTCIDTELYRPRASTNSQNATRPVVGWIGTSGNIVYLREVAAALRVLARRHDFELLVIATHRGTLDELELEGVNVRFEKWNPATEVTDIQRFDIGLMPLTDDEWSRYKCGLKLLQYMAIGIPGVASPVGVNAEIITVGKDGFLASTPDEWESALGQLLSNPQLRQQLGAAARSTVEQRYSIAANLPRWVEAVREAIQRTQ